MLLASRVVYPIVHARRVTDGVVIDLDSVLYRRSLADGPSPSALKALSETPADRGHVPTGPTIPVL